MDLSQYKQIRHKKFPLPQPKAPKSQPSPQNFHTIALIGPFDPESYEIIQGEGSEREGKKNVIMFNEHQYLKREFGDVYRLGTGDNGEVVRGIMGGIEESARQFDNNLIIYNALDLTPIEQLIFPWREYIAHNSNPDKTPETHPQSTLQSLLLPILSQKRNNTVITLSILGIRSDGSLEDELNYQWIEESKYIEDLLKIKEKGRLRVRKYRSQVKIFDLNRQQIKEWGDAEEILYHYSQIKEYLETWKQELQPGTNPKIGQLYEICQLLIDQQLGYIKTVHKRKLLLKLNQFLPASNPVHSKLTQLLKTHIAGQPSPSPCRDMPLFLFLKDCFEREKRYHFTLMTQLGTNQTLKEEAVCLSMDLAFNGLYGYLKNYCDRAEIVEEVKAKAKNFVPLTCKQRAEIKVATIENGLTKLKPKSLSIVKQSEAVVSKSFFYETYSSNEKKKPSTLSSNSFNIQTVLEDRKNTFQPYQFQKPATTMNRRSQLDDA